MKPLSSDYSVNRTTFSPFLRSSNHSTSWYSQIGTTLANPTLNIHSKCQTEALSFTNDIQEIDWQFYIKFRTYKLKPKLQHFCLYSFLRLDKFNQRFSNHFTEIIFFFSKYTYSLKSYHSFPFNSFHPKYTAVSNSIQLISIRFTFNLPRSNFHRMKW